MRQQDALGMGSALLVANPVPEAEQLDPELHDRALAEALAGAGRRASRASASRPTCWRRWCGPRTGPPWKPTWPP